MCIFQNVAGNSDDQPTLVSYGFQILWAFHSVISKWQFWIHHKLNILPSNKYSHVIEKYSSNTLSSSMMLQYIKITLLWNSTYLFIKLASSFPNFNPNVITRLWKISLCISFQSSFTSSVLCERICFNSYFKAFLAHWGTSEKENDTEQGITDSGVYRKICHSSVCDDGDDDDE